MASQKASTATMGAHIVLAGLIIQIIIFGFFVAVAFVFHRRLNAKPTHRSHDSSLPWKKFLFILYITSAFIMARSIVRVAEFVEGFQGTIILHEVFLYIFDAVPMAAVMAVFNVWYPSNFSERARRAMKDRETGQSNVELESQ